MIRVLQFADIINRYDFIESIVRWADPRLFEVSVCVRSSACNIGSPVYRPGTRVCRLNGLSRSRIPEAVFQLARLLQRMEIDLIHAHHFDQGVIAYLATRMYPKTQLVIGRHYSDAIYRVSSSFKRQLLIAVEQLMNRAAARIIVPSNFIRHLLVNQQGVDAGKIDVVPYGFEPDKYVGPTEAEEIAIRKELGLGSQEILFGNFSRLHEEKGHRFLLDAFAKIKEKCECVVLLLCGDGPERRAIQRQIDILKLRDCVRILGWRRDAISLIGAVDVVVQPTLQEAFSQVMVEAMWMEKPLLITDVSGVRDIIKDGENGIIVPRGDSAALALQMCRLAKDRAFRRVLGAAARRYVESNLVISKVIPQYEMSYFNAMGSRVGGYYPIFAH
jgi:glycosyltransferase involved in cell wall biosynthesis